MGSRTIHPPQTQWVSGGFCHHRQFYMILHVHFSLFSLVFGLLCYEQQTISQTMTIIPFSYAYISHLCLSLFLSFTLQRHYELFSLGGLQVWYTNGLEVFPTFLKVPLGLGRTLFCHCYGGGLDQPQGFHC